VLYVRVLPEQDASFAPEAQVHRLLLARGLRVPDVLYVEPHNALLQRSVMCTTAIPGQAIGYADPPANVLAIVREAGRELAVLNQVPIEGFGWIQRDLPADQPLRAEYPTPGEWLTEHVGPALSAFSRSELLSQPDLRAVHAALGEAIALFKDERAALAHGDFDPPHIYHLDGQYVGMIDFGEIRGTHPLYDIGHFAIESSDLLPALLEGYAEVTPLPADHMRRIHLTTLLIAARQAGRQFARQASVYEPYRRAIQRSLRALNM
jgi:aminoglycoside phosphotransferase (APT) family kinase protein